MTKVLYVAGWQRSGTTLLGDLLGSNPSVCHIGELTYLFTPSHPAGGICGCGSPIEKCPLWAAVLRDTDLGNSRPLAHQARLNSCRMRHVTSNLLRLKRGGTVPEYSNYLNVLYPAVLATAGADLVVDTSKSPGEALAALACPDVETRLLHLVRDPRGCAYSTSKRAKRHLNNAKGTLRTKSPIESSKRWMEVNGLSEMIKRSIPKDQALTVTYESLMSDAESTVSRILSWCGIATERELFSSGNVVTLKPSHTVMGNPNRFAREGVSLKLDDEWRTSMAKKDVVRATLPALPLLRHYGYQVIPR